MSASDEEPPAFWWCRTAPPQKFMKKARSYQVVERGIRKKGNKFYTDIRFNGKWKRAPFATPEAARAARDASRKQTAEAVVARRATRARRPPPPNRDANLAMHGKDAAQERDFLVDTFQPTAEARGWDVVVLNDGTRADVAIKRPEWETYLGIQVKTTQTVESGKKRTYQFKDTKGYTGLLVVCWVVEDAYGWAFDGEWLDGREAVHLKMTPVPKRRDSRNAAWHALSGKLPYDIDGLLEWIEKQVEDSTSLVARYPRHTEEYLRWEFGGKALDNAKERVSLHVYQTYFDPEARFPTAQNGSHDFESHGKRQQHKVASRNGDKAGFLAALHESAGMIGGTLTHRPYPTDAFDELVVTVFEGYKAHVWVIPAFVLKAQNCFRSDECAGVTSLYVYLPGTEQDAQVWGFTTDYYQGVYDVTLPAEAYEASPALFQELFPRV